MAMSLGEIIRRAVRDDNRSAKEICDAVGMSRGNLDKIYKKDSVNTDLLARICTVLDHDFFQYVNPFVTAEIDGPRLYGAEDDPGERRTPISRLNKCLGDLHDTKKDLDFMEREVALIKARLADKDRVIRLQDEKIDLLGSQLAECRRSQMAPE
jgi:DNA-binding Xre family transcriptional regulator